MEAKTKSRYEKMYRRACRFVRMYYATLDQASGYEWDSTQIASRSNDMLSKCYQECEWEISWNALTSILTQRNGVHTPYSPQTNNPFIRQS